MITLITILTLPLIVARALLILGGLISVKQKPDREKPTPYECGFEPAHKARLPFSLRFFILTVIFLVFDIEIAIILPLGIIRFGLPSSHLLITSFTVILILTAGLFHE